MHPLPLDTFGIALDRVLVIEEITVGAKGATSACIAVWGLTGTSGVPNTRDEELVQSPSIESGTIGLDSSQDCELHEHISHRPRFHQAIGPVN